LKSGQTKIVLLDREPRRGDTVGGRRAATPSFKHTIEWTVAELKAAGRKGTRRSRAYAVPGVMWLPQSWQLRLEAIERSAPGSRT